MAHPGHGPFKTVLVAALWRQIEEIVRADQDVETAAIGRIGVKDFTGGVSIKHAGTRPFLAREILDEFVVVHHLAAGFFLCCRRYLIILIEIAAERRDPFEAPAHAALERFDLRQRRPRDDDKRYVALRQVNDRAVEMIGKERTTWASCFPAGTEHEVINDQLAFAAEQVAQRSFAGWRVEHVVLLDFLPWQFTALAGELVAGAAKGLLLSEISFARGDPLLVRNDLVIVFLHLFAPLNRRSFDAPQVWNPQRRDRRNINLSASSSRCRRRQVPARWRCGRHWERRTLVS